MKKVDSIHTDLLPTAGSPRPRRAEWVRGDVYAMRNSKFIDSLSVRVPREGHLRPTPGLLENLKPVLVKIVDKIKGKK